MIENIGYFGAFLLAVCALPQTVLSVIQGHSRGLSHGFLWTWYIGEICLLYFVIATVGATGPLFYNYVANTLLLSIIIYYRYNPRKK